MWGRGCDALVTAREDEAQLSCREQPVSFGAADGTVEGRGA